MRGNFVPHPTGGCPLAAETPEWNIVPGIPVPRLSSSLPRNQHLGLEADVGRLLPKQDDPMRERAFLMASKSIEMGESGR
jgi:hypothetical protein